jgi:hypothetical protein
MMKQQYWVITALLIWFGLSIGNALVGKLAIQKELDLLRIEKTKLSIEILELQIKINHSQINYKSL